MHNAPTDFIMELFGKDVYDLELPDIKKRYRELLKKVHPDVGGSDEEVRKVINAYESLAEWEMGRYFPEAVRKPNVWDKSKKALMDYISKSEEVISFYDLWITSKGEVLKIEEMAYFHLVNAIKLIERTTPRSILIKDKRYAKMQSCVNKEDGGDVKVESGKIKLTF